MNNDRDVHLLSGAYALDAVNADEAAAVEAAMVRSEDLRGEIAELTDTAVMLGLAVRAEAPPRALRGRLLDAIAETPQLPVEPRVEGEQAVLSALPSGAHVAPARRRGRLRRRPALLLSVAAVALLLFGGGLVVDRVVMQQQSTYAEITTASDVRQGHASIAGGGSAAVYTSSRLDETAVVLTGMKVPSGKVLQMWRVKGASSTSAGLYTPTSGANYHVVNGALRPGEHLAVTVEPAGGSKHPTSDAVVAVRTA